MPKRRGRKKQPASNKANCEQDELSPNNKEEALQDDEVKRQIAAIRAIRDVETEQLRTKIRLLQLNFSKEQLQSPVLQFFENNLSNLSISKSGKEVNWKDEQNHADERTLHNSLLHWLSIAYPDYSTGIPSLAGGFDFSNKSSISNSFIEIKTDIFGADKLQIRSLVFEEPSDSQIQDGLQTPDVSNNRLSVGITPKAVGLPKCGEVLMSVHGSPLGVYKEDMETRNGRWLVDC